MGAQDDRVLAKAINRASQAGPALFVLFLGLTLSIVAWRFAAERAVDSVEVERRVLDHRNRDGLAARELDDLEERRIRGRRHDDAAAGRLVSDHL